EFRLGTLADEFAPPLARLESGSQDDPEFGRRYSTPPERGAPPRRVTELGPQRAEAVLGAPLARTRGSGAQVARTPNAIARSGGAREVAKPLECVRLIAAFAPAS